MIDQKIEEAMETGIYSKKDLLDWMKHLQEVEANLKFQRQTLGGYTSQQL